ISCYSFCNPLLYQLTPPVDHAESPTWDNRKGVLYFVDIHAGDIYSYEYTTGKLYSIHLNGEVTPVVSSKNDPDLLIVGLNRTIVALEWNGKNKFYRMKQLTTVSNQFPTSRFNDGKADKQGRLWFGTMGFEDARGVTPNQGLLYKITRENLQNPSVMIAPVNVSNGLTWNKANNKFYYIDTPTRLVMEYEYNDKRGEIKNGRVAFNLSEYQTITGFPDGMTIDRDDNLWIALYGGGAIIKVDPRTSNILRVEAVPAEAVTSVTWGGSNFDTLFVTTSRFGLTREQRLEQPAAGSVFAFTGLGTAGGEVFEADIIDPIENDFSGPGVYQIIESIDHAESPSWDNRNGLLYFVNIHEGQIYRYDFTKDEIQFIKLDGEVAPIILFKKNPNLLIACLSRSVGLGISASSETRILTTVSEQYPTSTMGHEDQNGLTPNEGVFYKLTCDNLNSPLVAIAPVNISNGIAWKKANNKFYYIDIPTRQVVEYT
ncbi:regucalcin-like, partial [Asbolus verrucosus]